MGHQLRRPDLVRPTAEPGSAFILSIDDEEFGDDEAENPWPMSCAPSSPSCAAATRTSDLPARRDAHLAPHSRTTCCASCTASSTCSRTRRSSSALRGARGPTVDRCRRPFSALTHYAADGFLFLGTVLATRAASLSKPGRADVPPVLRREHAARRRLQCAVEELGQLLDHTGPVAASERNAARIFNADHLYFVTNGTSTSNKIVWHSTVAPGDIVVSTATATSRSCTPIIMTGAIPVFLMPTRNNFGIIGPIPEAGIRWENIQKKIAAHPFANDKKSQAARADHHPITYDGILYNVEDIKEMLDGKIDTLHFDEAWLPHAAFHDFYGDYHAIGADRPRCKESMVFDAIDAQAAGRPHRPRRSWCRTPRARTRPRRLQRGLSDAHLDLAAVFDHRLVRRGGGDDGSAGGTALVEESIAEALDFRRAMRKVDEVGQTDWWFRSGAGRPVGRGHRGARLDAQARRTLARFRQLSDGFNMLDPIKATIITPGRCGRRFRRALRHSGGDRH